jgi:hypothetical protein
MIPSSLSWREVVGFKCINMVFSAMQNEIPSEYQGWWRIIETSQWVNDDLDILGTALISLTGYADRLRMFVLLAYVNCKPTKSGVSFI